MTSLKRYLAMTAAGVLLSYPAILVVLGAVSTTVVVWSLLFGVPGWAYVLM
ncbi:hypothetical protein [Ferrimonas senticii]|uniref:hypothetical protein n=1 Tax=Ferrimonas senticii TaxID=394566 RepID=UPI000416EFC7|nr:hypothetical protein [Ferrimonas senticii]